VEQTTIYDSVTQNTVVAKYLSNDFIIIWFIWYAKKIFTVAAPQTARNDQIYAPEAIKNKDVVVNAFAHE